MNRIHRRVVTALTVCALLLSALVPTSQASSPSDRAARARQQQEAAAQARRIEAARVQRQARITQARQQREAAERARRIAQARVQRQQRIEAARRQKEAAERARRAQAARAQALQRRALRARAQHEAAERARRSEAARAQRRERIVGARLQHEAAERARRSELVRASRADSGSSRVLTLEERLKRADLDSTGVGQAFSRILRNHERRMSELAALEVRARNAGHRSALQRIAEARAEQISHYRELRARALQALRVLLARRA